MKEHWLSQVPRWITVKRILLYHRAWFGGGV